VEGLPKWYNQDMDTIFESHIIKTDSCWLWIGAKNIGGYGYYRKNGKTHKAHRYAYTIYIGDIPTGLVIDHLCKVRACVNPEHLELVTQAENLYRGDTIAATSRAKSHCKNGHEFNTANTIIRKNGTRNCRTCTNLLKKKYRTAE
jgi:hypothetical protein